MAGSGVDPYEAGHRNGVGDRKTPVCLGKLTVSV
jgi:hypothetical protein